MATCQLCGDPADPDEQWCASCSIDIELEIDEMLDDPRPDND